MPVKDAARRIPVDIKTGDSDSTNTTAINLKAHVNNWKEIHEKNVEEHKLAFLQMIRSERNLYEAEEMLAAHERGEVYVARRA